MTTYSKRAKYLLSGLVIGQLFLSAGAVMAAPELLLKSDRSWDGGSFNYPKGESEITSVKLSLIEGKTARFHCHPVPTMGYVSKGKVRLETEPGKMIEYSEGASVVEVMKTVHRSFALEGDAEIIVFFAGAKNIPNTLFPNNGSDKDKLNFKKLCQ